jgi:hypothetical protein
MVSSPYKLSGLMCQIELSLLPNKYPKKREKAPIAKLKSVVKHVHI